MCSDHWIMVLSHLKDYCSCISSLISFLFFLHPALIPCEKQELQEKKRENSKSNCLHYYVKGGQETSRITESRKGGSYLRHLAMMLKTRGHATATQRESPCNAVVYQREGVSLRGFPSTQLQRYVAVQVHFATPSSGSPSMQ